MYLIHITTFSISKKNGNNIKWIWPYFFWTFRYYWQCVMKYIKVHEKQRCRNTLTIDVCKPWGVWVCWSPHQIWAIFNEIFMNVDRINYIQTMQLISFKQSWMMFIKNYRNGMQPYSLHKYQLHQKTKNCWKLAIKL